MKKILIINANYYKKISDRLVFAAKKNFKKKKFNLSIINVPGIYEAPFILAKNMKKFDAFLVLGCVIKGETPHFDYISRSVFNGITQLSINYKKPITNGIITCLNMTQALNRSANSKSSKKPNKGDEASKALVSLLYNAPKRL